MDNEKTEMTENAFPVEGTDTQNAPQDASEVNPGTLYVVATPIGNLSDMSERGKKILGAVDFIAAEDTRVSGKLLGLYGLKNSFVNYFEHNKAEMGEKITARLLAGESCAIVTDAGTPAVSDPGEELCDLCHKKGITVVPVPGCSAAITALCASGLPSRRFSFEGFLSRDNAEAREILEECKNEKRTMIFYEAPHRLKKTLETFREAFGDGRRVCLARELTKLNEEILRTTLGDAVKTYETKEPRGEYVIVIEGKTSEDGAEFWKDLSVCEHVDFYIAQGMPKMDAIKQTAKDRGVPKNSIYKELL